MSPSEGFGEETGKCIHVNGEEGTYNGPERRRTEFTSRAAKHYYDAAQLLRLSKEMRGEPGEYDRPHNLIRRKDDDVDNLKRAIYWKVFSYGLFGDWQNDADLKK